ncbi:hypothetical protein, variant [Magnaporthiopsis poae ATCC 64411]|nr:hypothetical protein, variant [Magnaporthiopsis poae ATCC 64411]
MAATFAIIVTTSTKSGFCFTLLKELDVWRRSDSAGDTEGTRLKALGGQLAAANRGEQRKKSVLRGIVWSILAIMNIVSMVAGILLWVRCSPIYKGWRPSVEGTCWGEFATITPPRINTAVTGIMDFVLSVLPMYMLRDVPLRTGERVGLMFCFSLGLFAAVTGFLKTSEVHILAGNDVTFDIVPLTIWGSAEPNLILIAISLPESRHLFFKGSRYGTQPPTPQGLRDATTSQMAARSSLKADAAPPDPDSKTDAAPATHSVSARTSRDDIWEVLSYYGVQRSPPQPRTAPPPPRATVVMRPRDGGRGRHAQAPMTRPPREMSRDSRAAWLYGRDAYAADLRRDAADMPAPRRSK